MAYERKTEFDESLNIQPGENLVDVDIQNRPHIQLAENCDVMYDGLTNLFNQVGVQNLSTMVDLEPYYFSSNYIRNAQSIKDAIIALDRALYSIYTMTVTSTASTSGAASGVSGDIIIPPTPVVPDPVPGYGRITGTITYHDLADVEHVVAGAHVSCAGQFVDTDENGSYGFSLLPGTGFKVEVKKEGFRDYILPTGVQVLDSTDTIVNIDLTTNYIVHVVNPSVAISEPTEIMPAASVSSRYNPFAIGACFGYLESPELQTGINITVVPPTVTRGVVSLRVVDGSGNAIPAAAVLIGTTTRIVGDDGNYWSTVLNPGTYTLQITRVDYNDYTQSGIVVVANTTTSLGNIVLTPATVQTPHTVDPTIVVSLGMEDRSSQMNTSVGRFLAKSTDFGSTFNLGPNLNASYFYNGTAVASWPDQHCDYGSNGVQTYPQVSRLSLSNSTGSAISRRTYVSQYDDGVVEPNKHPTWVTVSTGASTATLQCMGQYVDKNKNLFIVYRNTTSGELTVYRKGYEVDSNSTTTPESSAPVLVLTRAGNNNFSHCTIGFMSEHPDSTMILGSTEAGSNAVYFVYETPGVSGSVSVAYSRNQGVVNTWSTVSDDISWATFMGWDYWNVMLPTATATSGILGTPTSIRVSDGKSIVIGYLRSYNSEVYLYTVYGTTWTRYDANNNPYTLFNVYQDSFNISTGLVTNFPSTRMVQRKPCLVELPTGTVLCFVVNESIDTGDVSNVLRFGISLTSGSAS